MRCDVLVVGAGPAGSAAAAAAAEGGARVLMLEKKHTIGQPVQCAEFVPRPLLREAGVEEPGVVQEVKGIRSFFPDGSVHEHNSAGYMLDRATFDRSMAERAVKAGAELMTAATLVSLKDGRAAFVNDGGETEVEAKVVIGADGPRSTVGFSIGVMNGHFIHAAQMVLPLKEPMEHTEVHFLKRFTGGYAWVFPKGDVANVGVGILQTPLSSDARPVRMLLEIFADRMALDGKIGTSVMSRTGGLIPVGGPLRTVKDNVILVGDAAGHTHPITGGGIPQAVVCGRMAGTAAARAALEDDMSNLDAYEIGWQNLFGQELDRAVERRRYMERGWEDLDRILPRCWVTFREYYE